MQAAAIPPDADRVPVAAPGAADKAPTRQQRSPASTAPQRLSFSAPPAPPPAGADSAARSADASSSMQRGAAVSAPAAGTSLVPLPLGAAPKLRGSASLEAAFGADLGAQRAAETHVLLQRRAEERDAILRRSRGGSQQAAKTSSRSGGGAGGTIRTAVRLPARAGQQGARVLGHFRLAQSGSSATAGPGAAVGRFGGSLIGSAVAGAQAAAGAFTNAVSSASAHVGAAGSAIRLQPAASDGPETRPQTDSTAPGQPPSPPPAALATAVAPLPSAKPTAPEVLPAAGRMSHVPLQPPPEEASAVPRPNGRTWGSHWPAAGKPLSLTAGKTSPAKRVPSSIRDDPQQRPQAAPQPQPHQPLPSSEPRQKQLRQHQRQKQQQKQPVPLLLPRPLQSDDQMSRHVSSKRDGTPATVPLPSPAPILPWRLRK